MIEVCEECQRPVLEHIDSEALACFKRAQERADKLELERLRRFTTHERGRFLFRRDGVQR